VARSFNDANNEYLHGSTTHVTYPFAMVAWARTDDLTIHEAIMGQSSEDDNNYNGFWLMVRGAESGDYVAARCYGSGGAQQAATSSGVSANTWHHCCAIFVARDARRALIDGGSKGTDSGDVISVSSVVNTTVAPGISLRS